MNKLERIEEEYPALYNEAIYQHNQGHTNNHSISESKSIGDLLFWSETPQDHIFWELVSHEKFDKARELQPHLFEPVRWRAEKGYKYWAISKHKQIFHDTEEGHQIDDDRWNNNRYFQTEALALASINPEPWRAEEGGKYWTYTKEGYLTWGYEHFHDLTNKRYESGNYFQTQELAESSLQPEKEWIPAMGEEYWKLSGRDAFSNFRATKDDDRYKDCYPTKAAALASRPDAGESIPVSNPGGYFVKKYTDSPGPLSVAAKQSPEDMWAQGASYKFTDTSNPGFEVGRTVKNLTDGTESQIIHTNDCTSTMTSPGYRISDGKPQSVAPPKPPEHEHAHSYVAAFGTDYSSTHPLSAACWR